MSAHPPIGACCYRPRFNAVGGVDGCGSTGDSQGRNPVRGVRQLERTIVFSAVGIFGKSRGCLRLHFFPAVKLRSAALLSAFIGRSAMSDLLRHSSQS